MTDNKEMDRLWADEAAERWAAYQRGEIKALPLEEVLAKYRTESTSGSSCT